MAIVSEDPSQPCYDIKSADLSLLALLLKTTNIEAVSAALKQQMAETPGFFDQDPVVVDVSALGLESDQTLDLQALLAVLREHQFVPLAIKGAQEPLLVKAKVWAWSMLQMPVFGVLCGLKSHHQHQQHLANLRYPSQRHLWLRLWVPWSLTSHCVQANRCMPKAEI